MTHEDALDTAIANKCVGRCQDFARGLIDRDQLEERIQRRLPEITAVLREL